MYILITAFSGLMRQKELCFEWILIFIWRKIKLTSKSSFRLTKISTRSISTNRQLRAWIISFTLVNIKTIIAIANEAGIAFALKSMFRIDTGGLRMTFLPSTITFIKIFCLPSSRCCCHGSGCLFGPGPEIPRGSSRFIRIFCRRCPKIPKLSFRFTGLSSFFKFYTTPLIHFKIFQYDLKTIMNNASTVEGLCLCYNFYRAWKET